MRIFISMLPSEMMFEILSRLPTESVSECKLVSKPWKNVVEHPSFSQLHFNHLNHESGKSSFLFYTIGRFKKRYYYCDYDENLNRFSRTIRINLKPPSHSYILGSCNGLICFNAWDEKSYLRFEPAYICNPITREYILLPKPESERKNLLSGFGYCPSTNEYKVVRIYNSREDPFYGTVQVYTLGSGIGWRNARKIDYDITHIEPRGVFANGAIYWVDLKGTLFSLDLADEEFHKLPSPPCNPSYVVRLRVLGGFLCAYYIYPEGSHIWVLKTNTNYKDVNWRKELIHKDAQPITFTKSGGLLCYDCCDKKVYCYAPEASSSRMFVDFGDIFRFGVPHRNTLVSLKALGEEDTRLMDSGGRARFSVETESSVHLPTEENEESNL